MYNSLVLFKREKPKNIKEGKITAVTLAKTG